MTNKLFHLLCYSALTVVLVTVYFACFKFSNDGYGYPGYKGYHTGHHSHWYFYRHSYAYEPSVRENSVSGHKFSRKGINGGK